MTYPSMLDVAKAAVHHVGGVTYTFNIIDYPSTDECRRDMIKFRNAFYAFKAREIRRILKEIPTTKDTMYDNLSCSMKKTSTGWQLMIYQAVYDGSKFTDANGNPINWDAEIERVEQEFSPEEIARYATRR